MTFVSWPPTSITHAITPEQTRGTFAVACDFSHDFIGERHRHAPIPRRDYGVRHLEEALFLKVLRHAIRGVDARKARRTHPRLTISPAPSSTATFVAVDPTSTPIPSISTLSCRGEDIRNALSCAFRFAHAAPGCPTPKHEAARHAAQ